MEPELSRHFLRDRALARSRRAVDGDDRCLAHASSPPRDTRKRVEVFRERLAHAPGVVDAHLDSAQRRERKGHRHAAIVAGLSAAGGVTRIESSPSSTAAPSLRNSVAMAAMRSVSLTRQLAMFLIVLGPPAKRANTAAVIAASGM